MPYYKGVSRIGDLSREPPPPRAFRADPAPKPDYTRWIIAAILAAVIILVVIYCLTRRSQTVAYRYAA
jgi:hypothetical protein